VVVLDLKLTLFGEKNKMEAYITHTISATDNVPVIWCQIAEGDKSSSLPSIGEDIIKRLESKKIVGSYKTRRAILEAYEKSLEYTLFLEGELKELIDKLTEADPKIEIRAGPAPYESYLSVLESIDICGLLSKITKKEVKRATKKKKSLLERAIRRYLPIPGRTVSIRMMSGESFSGIREEYDGDMYMKIKPAKHTKREMEEGKLTLETIGDLVRIPYSEIKDVVELSISCGGGIERVTRLTDGSGGCDRKYITELKRSW